MLDLFKQKMSNTWPVKQKQTLFLLKKPAELNFFQYYVKRISKKYNKNNIFTASASNCDKTSKHFPSTIREWTNSIYVFNKNSLNLIPNTTKLVNIFIKSYFNIYNKRLELKMRTKTLKLRLKRLSTNKFYVSNGGFKHTNNKVNINLFVFNRQKQNYIQYLKKSYLKSIVLKNENQFKSRNLNTKLIKRLNIIKHKGIQTALDITEDKYSLIKGLNTVQLNKNNDMFSVYKIKSFSNYTKNFYKDLIQKSLKKIRMYFYYKQLLYINRSKLSYNYLQYLKKHLEKIYNKNVEFNIINLKKFYLNSDILTQAITGKLTKNRRKLLRYLSAVKNKIKIKKKKVFLGYIDTKDKLIKNLSNNNNIILQRNIIDNLKYKDITGFRLQAKGRLTKRYAAARSVYKHKHKGGIYDIDSSFRGLSTVLLKGNLKSNTQYTNLKSKTRIGSFGIKGWVSGN